MILKVILAFLSPRSEDCCYVAIQRLRAGVAHITCVSTPVQADACHVCIQHSLSVVIDGLGTSVYTCPVVHLGVFDGILNHFEGVAHQYSHVENSATRLCLLIFVSHQYSGS